MSRPFCWMLVFVLVLGSSACRSRTTVSLEDDSQEPSDPVPALIDALKDKDSDIRFAATLELARRREKAGSAVPALTGALKDGDALVRSSAADALGRIGDKEAIAPLIETLKDPNPEVRAAAVRALELLRATKAAPQLLVLAREDGDGEVRSQARRVLWEVDPARARKAGIRAD